MNVYRVHTTRKNKHGEPVFINFGCDIPSLKAFVDELNKGKAIYGSCLNTRWAKDGDETVLEVIGKTPYGLAPAGVSGVENPIHRYVEFAE